MSPESLPSAGVSHSLTMAVIESSSTPLLLLDGTLTVVAASTSFCVDFQIDAAHVRGRSIFDLGAGEWKVPQLRSLLLGAVAGEPEIDRYEMDLKSNHHALRHLVLNVRKLDYGAAEDIRVILAISDVTEARASKKLNDTLLHEKSILLQEVQHRIANSLQIIASVLMMSARRVQSEETRGHLQNAHLRVMAIAAVQEQLTIATMTRVKLHAYFIRLCQSLSASMIRDPEQLELVVTVDESIVDADVSISLGLIVTELVINALKHAFPADRSGRIAIDYWSRGDKWTLSVTDDGVGMPAKEKGIQPGLGTSIVFALATKLGAVVRMTQAQPGTFVAIIRD